MTTKAEIDKAKAWRDRLGLSLDDLAPLTGFSRGALYWYFWGLTPPRTAKHIMGKQKSKPVEDVAWQRFKNVCAGVEYQMKRGKGFDWQP